MLFHSPGRPLVLRASPWCTWLRAFSAAYGKSLCGGINIIITSNSVPTKLNSSSPPHILHILVSISTHMSTNYNTLLPLHSTLNWFIPLLYPTYQMKGGKSALFQVHNVSSGSHLQCWFELLNSFQGGPWFPFSCFTHRQGSDHFPLNHSEKPSMAAHSPPLQIAKSSLHVIFLSALARSPFQIDTQ